MARFADYRRALLTPALLVCAAMAASAMAQDTPTEDADSAIGAPNAAAPVQAKPPAEALPPAKPDKAQAGSARPGGRLIRVPLPFAASESADAQVTQAIQRALADLPGGDERPVLVLEFVVTKGQFGEGTDFGRALALARTLSSGELAAVKTVAFVPRTIKGHGVLAVMACEEIVMAADAELGEAGIDEAAAAGADPTVIAGYKQIADRRRTIPPQVAVGMVDKDVEVLKVDTEVATEYVLRSELDALKARATVQSETVIKQAGELGRFSGREGRELGFVKYLAADRGALAKALSLQPEALEDDPSGGGEWSPLLVRIRGPVNGAQVSHVERKIDDAVRNGEANFIVVSIDSPGGSSESSMTLANMLADLDASQVRTVAFIEREARGDAALLALACDQIVMAEDAIIGGAGAADLDARDLELVRESIRDNLAPKKSRGWSLTAAMLDPELHIFRYTRKGDGRVEYFSPEEAAAQEDAAEWIQGDELTSGRGALRLRGMKAHEIGLARHLASDFRAFKQLYGMESDPKLIEPGWADYLIDKLASPGVGWLLLLVGLAALYAEIQAPGIGLGGFISGVCFLLFFWNRFFEGTAGWLEVFLFIGGVCCVLIEIFVLPGVAVFGLGGGLLILASLILASQTFVLPHNEYQWNQLQGSLVSLLGVFVGLGIAVALIRRYLPRTPWVSSMLLEPPTGEEREHLDQRESIVDFRHLVGKQGTAATPLIPGGKARFEGHLIDVTADGEVIERGQPVLVTEVHGNRVVVKSVE